MDRRAERTHLTSPLMSAARFDKVSVLSVFRRTCPGGKVALVLATWFGTGLVAKAPGTFGSLAAMPLVLIGWLGTAYSAAALAGMIPVAFWASHRAAKLLGKKDPPEVVIDEAVGLLMTMLYMPITWQSIGLGFVLFRCFDILKPWPVRQAERLTGGLGIVMDDLLAGLYAHLFLKGILWLAA